MGYSLLFADKAQKQLGKLSKIHASRIIDKLNLSRMTLTGMWKVVKDIPISISVSGITGSSLI